jgi:predicted transposase/invertase (TIGR01784 family)
MAAKYELGIEEGIERGIEKGKLENKLETTRMMLEKGEPLEKILEYSKLSMDDLKKNGIL